MRKTLIILLFSAFPVIFAFTGCAGNSSDKQEGSYNEKPETISAESIFVNEESDLLLKDLAENGNYVNGRDFPSLIKASNVFEQLESNTLLLDIRTKEEFASGHIKGAQNVAFSELPVFFETGIKPFEYNRIVIISSDGQTASYTTSLLRLMGYGNVYAMRWGMSAWNASFAEKGWFSGRSSEFQDRLETKINESQPGRSLPELNSGMLTGEEIAELRFSTLFAEGLDIMIEASEVFANPSAYYVINYDRRDKYESGHIPGAVRYKPGATLSIVKEMASIPADKTVVIYCGTGHNACFVTAYLRLFGYDARALKYGNNSFMYDKMVKEKAILSWLPFTSEDVNDYEVVK